MPFAICLISLPFSISLSTPFPPQIFQSVCINLKCLLPLLAPWNRSYKQTSEISVRSDWGHSCTISSSTCYIQNNGIFFRTPNITCCLYYLVFLALLSCGIWSCQEHGWHGVFFDPTILSCCKVSSLKWMFLELMVRSISLKETMVGAHPKPVRVTNYRSMDLQIFQGLSHGR